MIPEELTNESCWNWTRNTWLKKRQEKKKLQLKKKKNPQKIHRRVLAKEFTNLDKLFKKLKNNGPNTKDFYEYREMFMVHYLKICD